MSQLALISVEADTASTTHTDRMRAPDDSIRQSFAGGRVFMSHGIAFPLSPLRPKAQDAVQAFSAFSLADDPYDDHKLYLFDLVKYQL